jgi:hypothetical protein
MALTLIPSCLKLKSEHLSGFIRIGLPNDESSVRIPQRIRRRLFVAQIIGEVLNGWPELLKPLPPAVRWRQQPIDLTESAWVDDITTGLTLLELK